MLIGSSTVCSFCVLIIIICSALQNQNPNLGLVGISFVYVFLAAFAAVWFVPVPNPHLPILSFLGPHPSN
jgi:hypothetical protein